MPSGKKAVRGQGKAGARHVEAGEVRIIGGQWRRLRLRFPADEQIRPTPDRVRETLFNWLGQELDGLSCADLFAGSGVLGIEAASRGAARVTLVDSNPRVTAALQETLHRLGTDRVNVVRGDALEFINGFAGALDLVFLDPPYGDGPPEAILEALIGRMASGGMVYYEGARDYLPGPGWKVLRKGRAGRVHYHLMQAA